MGKKLFIFLAVIIILIIIFISLLLHKFFFKTSNLDYFLSLEIRKESFSGISLDGKQALFKENKGSFPKSTCKVYSKDIENKKVELLADLNFDCKFNDYLSKEGNYLFFDISNAVKNKITSFSKDIFVVNGLYKHSIYGYDIKNKKLFLIKEGVEAKDFNPGGGPLTGTDYRIIGLSPKDNNKILIEKSIYEVVYKKFEASENWGDVWLTTNEIWVLDLETNEEILILNETISSEIDYLDFRYHQTGLTRWSPDGEAIIYETGKLNSLSDKYSELEYNKENPSLNTQYIIYLEDLERKELKPENVKGDITSCGYYYNENLESYGSLLYLIPEYVIPFPDGKTYLSMTTSIHRFCPFPDCPPDHEDYILRTNEQFYCKPITN